MTDPSERDPFLVPVLEKLDAATRDDLIALLGGWPIEPGIDSIASDHAL